MTHLQWYPTGLCRICSKRPLRQVAWNIAVAFCRWTCDSSRLPPSFQLSWLLPPGKVSYRDLHFLNPEKNTKDNFEILPPTNRRIFSITHKNFLPFSSLNMHKHFCTPMTVRCETQNFSTNMVNLMRASSAQYLLIWTLCFCSGRKRRDWWMVSHQRKKKFSRLKRWKETVDPRQKS